MILRPFALLSFAFLAVAAQAAEPIKLGHYGSLTGKDGAFGAATRKGVILAIDEINAKGGVLGKKIELVIVDGASDWPTFAEKAKKLLVNDKVAAVFGCWTSASRKAVLPVFEKENGLLYYPTFYEGLEQSKNVIYTGQEATQQILYGLDWTSKEKKAKTFFLVGSDYFWPRTSMKIARKHVENFQKCKIVGEEYYPLGSTNFGSLMNKIKLQKPDCIFTAVVGGSNVAFYKALKAAGISGDNWGLAVFAENLLDRKYLNEVIPAIEFGGSFASPGAHRLIGVEGRFSF